MPTRPPVGLRAIKLSLAALAALVAVLALPSLASARDRNHDRIPDRWEKRHHLSLAVNQARRDQDRDGLRNRTEFLARTDPRDPDTDNDGVRDGDEDADHDGVDNENEEQEHTNPGDPDTDNDGVRDGAEDPDHDRLTNHREDQSGNDPMDEDTDNDGIEDGDENAGTITSFEDGVLTIDLFGGGSVSGQVTDETEIRCETEDEDEAANDNDDAGGVQARDEGGDNSGPGNAGEDNSGPGNEDADDVDEDEDRGDEDNLCTTDDLTADTVVHEAELELENGQAVFEEVELVK